MSTHTPDSWIERQEEDLPGYGCGREMGDYTETGFCPACDVLVEAAWLAKHMLCDKPLPEFTGIGYVLADFQRRFGVPDMNEGVCCRCICTICEGNHSELDCPERPSRRFGVTR